MADLTVSGSFAHQKYTGSNSDRRKSKSQGEREDTRRRTFTRWINQHLETCDPPVKVHDLFKDIQDGKILMALLEKLSGCKMLYRFRSSPHRIFRLNNIAKVLNFLEDRNVRLLNIEASDVADGNPSVVLRLIWNIIVFFHIKKVTGGLHRYFFYTASLSSSSTVSDVCNCYSPISPCDEISNTLPLKRRRAPSTIKYRGRAIKTLLLWVLKRTTKYGVDVWDFGKSWRSGLAFLALIKSIEPDLVDMRTALSTEPRDNVKRAFTIAHENFGIRPLLDPEDITVSAPDEQSIIIYVAQFPQHFPNQEEDEISEPCSHYRILEELRDNTFSTPCYPEIARRRKCFSETSHGESLRLSSTFCKCQEPECCTHVLDSSLQQPSISSLHKLVDLKDESRVKSSPRESFSEPNGHSFTGRECWSPSNQENLSVGMEIDDGMFSESSEEGIYTLSALDSDEEDAYNYILELDQEESEKNEMSNASFEPAANLGLGTAFESVMPLDTTFKSHNGGEWTFVGDDDLQMKSCTEAEDMKIHSNGQNVRRSASKEQVQDRPSSQLSTAKSAVLQDDKTDKPCQDYHLQPKIQHTGMMPPAARDLEPKSSTLIGSEINDPNVKLQNINKLTDIYTAPFTYAGVNKTVVNSHFENDSILDGGYSAEVKDSCFVNRESIDKESGVKSLSEENFMKASEIIQKDYTTEVYNADAMLQKDLKKGKCNRQKNALEQHSHNQEITAEDTNSQKPRKVIHSVSVSSAQRLDTEELKLLSFLWILLYCVLILPQMELCLTG